MQKVKEFFGKVGQFIKRHVWSILLILVALGVGGFFLWDTYSAEIGYVIPSIIIPEKEPETFPAPFSGRQVSKDRLSLRPIAVVVENHPDARPQSGLNEADIVFEATAEGGITRFLAIYQSQESKQIGPVRSARQYSVEWARGYDALYAHVGGSKEAIAMIPKLSVLDLNQFYLGNYFWRDSSRWAPHNVYTTTAKLREAAKSKKYSPTKEDIPGMKFKEDPKEEERPTAQKFTVNFNASFAPTYTYSAACNCYLRSIKGVKQTDRLSKKQIQAKNVVVAFGDITQKRIRTATYTYIDTDSTGAAYFYIDGKKQVGKWSRAKNSIIKFYDAKNKEIEFNVGTTWIDYVPKGTVVK